MGWVRWVEIAFAIYVLIKLSGFRQWSDKTAKVINALDARVNGRINEIEDRLGEPDRLESIENVLTEHQGKIAAIIVSEEQKRAP